jgi:hypothetical protein
MIDTVNTIRTLSLVLLTIVGVASAQAGNGHTDHTIVHNGGRGNYHGNYHGGNGYYNHGGQGYYANGTVAATGTAGTTVANITTAATTSTTRPFLSGFRFLSFFPALISFQFSKEHSSPRRLYQRKQRIDGTVKNLTGSRAGYFG